MTSQAQALTESLAYCQVEAYADDPMRPLVRKCGDAQAKLTDLLGVLQCLLDLHVIDDVTGDLAQWAAEWGVTLHFAPPLPAEAL